MEVTFAIYGTRSTPAGLHEFSSYQCPHCEKTDTTYAVIYSMYFHIFWIPFFPDDKQMIATCSECSFTRGTEKFGPKLFEQCKGLTKKYRHPWWTSSLTILLLAVILAIILNAVV
ncbi:MAG: zinc-ribbon domain-containing protein [Chitinophagaceae bacterium]